MHPIFVMRFVRLKPPMYAQVVNVLNRALAATGAANA